MRKTCRFRLSLLCLGFFIIALSAGVLSCSSPQAVATFAEAADKALGEGPPVFHDLHDSCIRRHAAAQPIAPVFLAAPGASASTSAAEPAVCVRLGQQADALSKASGVVSDYFRAVQELASFNTSSVSGASLQAAESAASGASLGATEIDSIGKLAGFVTRAFTEHYQQSHLMEDLREADASVSALTKAFETIVTKDYAGLLDEEQRDLTMRYQDVGDSSDLAVTLLLNRAYRDDLNSIQRRRAAAQAYVTALQQIRAGHHELAEYAKHMGANDLSVAIEPYTSQLQASVAAVQKGF